jgi:hypothetical protein
MVKHIKAQYSQDGNLTNKEKAIAYATAWKAKKANEEVEQIDEVSKDLLTRNDDRGDGYISKAVMAHLIAKSKGDRATAAKRAKGVNLARAKVFPKQYVNSPDKAKVPATNEETEQVDEAYVLGHVKPEHRSKYGGNEIVIVSGPHHPDNVDKEMGDMKGHPHYASLRVSKQGQRVKYPRWDKFVGNKATNSVKEEVDRVDEASYSAKSAKAGKDIGKKGKNFDKIAKSAADRYGSKDAGKRVAGAVLAKLRQKSK